MNEASPKSNRLNSKGTHSATSSPGSAAGPSLFDWLDGMSGEPFGPALAPASRTRRRGSRKATPTTATSGPRSTGSSASAALTLCLVNRLKERFGTGGLMEFKQTWKEKVTPSGIVYWAHTASARPISDSDCFGWPSPSASNNGDTLETWQSRHDRQPKRDTGGALGMSLNVVAQLVPAGWPTPMAQNPDAGNCDYTRAMEAAMGLRESKNSPLIQGWNTPRATDGENGGPNQAGGALPADAAMAAPWATPTVQDSANCAGPSQYDRNSHPLNVQATLAGWSTPRAEEKCQHNSKDNGAALSNQATMLAGWPTPTESMVTEQDLAQAVTGGNSAARLPYKDSGLITTSSPAETTKPAASRGVLNPCFSAWLMGFPPIWTYCGLQAKRTLSRKKKSKGGSGSSEGTEMPSSPKRRPSSSARLSKQKAVEAA